MPFIEILKSKSSSVSEASKEFKDLIYNVLSSFGWTPALPFFAAYQSIYSNIEQVNLFNSKHSEFTFAVSPIKTEKNDSEDSFKFVFYANERFFIRTLANYILLRYKDKKLYNKIMKCELYKEAEDLLIKKYKANGLSISYSLMRGLLIHEAGHLLLAHPARLVDTAEKFDIDLFVNENSSDSHKALVVAFCKLANIVYDAFINKGLETYMKLNTPLLEKKINALLYDVEIEEYFYMYKSEAFLFLCDKIFCKEKTLLDLIENSLKDPKFNNDLEFLRDAVDDNLLDILEEHVLNPLTAALIEDMQNILNQQASNQDNAQQHSKDTQSNQNSQQNTNQSQSKSAQRACNHQGGSQSSQNDQNTDQDNANQSKNSTYNIAKEAIDSIKNKNRSTIIQDGIRYEFDENGELVDVRIDNSNINTGDLQEKYKELSKKAENAAKLAKNLLNDEEVQKMRGLNTLFRRSLEFVSKKKFNWKSILANLVATLPGIIHKKSWIEPVRALKRKGWHLPDSASSTLNQKEYFLLYMTDSSGSMSQQELIDGLSIILSTSKNKIKKILFISHDSVMYKLTDNQKTKLSRYISSLNIDKFLLRNGFLCIDIEKAENNFFKFKKALKIFANELPAGGTSHYDPLVQISQNPALKKFFKNYKLSGLIAFTDCYSDLEKINRNVLTKLLKNKYAKMIIINSSSRNYSHTEWPVVPLKGQLRIKRNRNKKFKSI